MHLTVVAGLAVKLDGPGLVLGNSLPVLVHIAEVHACRGRQRSGGLATINRADVPPSLHRCLATTNIIESPQSGVLKKTGNICRRRDGGMILRWVGGAFLLTEQRFRRIMSYQELGRWPTF